MAWQGSVQMASYPLRTFLTVSSLVLGVAPVVIVSAMLTGVDDTVATLLRALGPRVVTIKGHSENETLSRAEMARRHSLSAREADSLRQAVPAAVFGIIERKGLLSVSSHLGAIPDAVVDAVDVAHARIHNLQIEVGRRFVAQDMDRRQRVAIVGADIVAQLLGSSCRVGHPIDIAGTPFEIVGCIGRRPSLLGLRLNKVILVPIGALPKLTHRGSETLEAEVWSAPEDIEAAVQALRSRLRLIRGLHAGDPDTFSIQSNEALEEFYQRSTAATYAVTVGLSSVWLIVGGIGVMSVMSASVASRAGEVALRRVAGATRTDIRTQFLVEAAYMSGVGGLVGLGLGTLVVNAVQLPVPARVDPVWGVLSVALCVTTGLVAGWIPAEKASRVDPALTLQQHG